MQKLGQLILGTYNLSSLSLFKWTQHSTELLLDCDFLWNFTHNVLPSCMPHFFSSGCSDGSVQLLICVYKAIQLLSHV